MNRIIICFLTLPIFFSACQPEDDFPPTPNTSCEIVWELIPSPEDTCFQLPRNNLGQVLSQNAGRYLYMPEFNPRNKDEFICIAGESQDPGQATFLGKFNLCTGLEGTVFDFSDQSPPSSGQGRIQWGASDWVAFASGGRLKLIRPDGTQLTTLDSESTGSYTRPAWFFEGERLYGFKSFPGTGTALNLLLDPSTGLVTDTLPFTFGFPRYKNGRLAAVSLGEIGWVDISDYVFTSLVSETFWPILDLGWQDDRHILWTTEKGFFRVNIETSQIDTIRSTPCENRRYNFFSVKSSEDNLVLLSRNDFRFEEDILFSYNELVLIDLDTNEEWILQLD